jgi:hypothetical protein
MVDAETMYIEVHVEDTRVSVDLFSRTIVSRPHNSSVSTSRFCWSHFFVAASCIVLERLWRSRIRIPIANSIVLVELGHM